MNPLPEIADIAGPMAIPAFPWVMTLIVAATLLAAIGAWWIFRPKKPAPRPLMPREVALQELGDISTRLNETEATPFAEEISNILRHFITLQFGLRAEYQTTPEFLTTATKSMFFSEQENMRLRLFLETADSLKFGDPNAKDDLRTKQMLLEHAEQLVRGGIFEEANVEGKS